MCQNTASLVPCRSGGSSAKNRGTSGDLLAEIREEPVFVADIKKG